MPISLTRRIAFAAAHRYRVAAWRHPPAAGTGLLDAERNAAVFGLCARPNYHGHSYICDVTVTGPLDPATGFVVDLGVLDAALQREVRDRFDHANINLDIPEFADGLLIPTGENLARFIAERVQAAIGRAARITRVTVAEDATLSATYEPD